MTFPHLALKPSSNTACSSLCDCKISDPWWIHPVFNQRCLLPGWWGGILTHLKIWVRQLGWIFPTEWKSHKIHVPNHQPVYIFISGRDQPRLFPYCDELRLTISQRKYHSEPARCTSTLIWRREQHLVLLNARTAVLQDVNFLQLPIWRKWSEALYIGCWASGNFAIWDFSSRRHGNWRILVWCAYENSLNLRNWMGYHLVI